VPRSVDDPLTTNEFNVTGTLNVLIAARDAGVKRVVYAASSSAYGDIEGEYKTEVMSPRPLSPYGVSKLAGEYYCQAFTEVYGLETVALRYFNVFGPRQDETSHYAAVIPKFISAMLCGEQPTIYGDGTQSRDFTYIDNVVHGNLLAANSPDANGQMMNLATGGNVTLLELVDKLNHLLGTSLHPKFSDPRPGDILHSRAGIDKARDLLDFAPIVDFDTGLARTLAWFRSR
jgi:UDP-glucose 4-epimerase